MISYIFINKICFALFFQERRLPSGQDSIAGETLTFVSATRHHSGN